MFRGSLDKQYSGDMTGSALGEMQMSGQQDLRIAIVPGSGSGELAGISGELTLRLEAGVHFYDLHYQLKPQP